MNYDGWSEDLLVNTEEEPVRKNERTRRVHARTPRRLAARAASMF